MNCPIPGKRYTTDNFYMPLRYSTQVMSQMASKGCSEYLFISYTPESTTVIRGFSNDHSWQQVFNLATDLYGNENITKPSRKHPNAQIVSDGLKQFCSQSSSRAEFPVKAIECSWNSPKAAVLTEVHTKHQPIELRADNPLVLEECAVYLSQSLSDLIDAYNALRRPAKELMITMASDLERMDWSEASPRTAPIMYNLSGFSLKSKSVRNLLYDAVEKWAEYCMTVKAISFDRQFVDIATSRAEGHPLTMYKLQKAVWDDCKHVTKQQQITYLSKLNHSGKISCHQDLSKDIIYNCKQEFN